MKRFFAACAALLLLAPLVALSTPAAFAKDAGVATVSPAEGPVGTTFSFHFSGFDKTERAGYWLNMPNGTMLEINRGKGITTVNGTVDVQWTPRAGNPAGWWTMVVQGTQSDVVKTVSFQVLPSDTAAAPGDVNVAPTTGAAGTTFAFMATGFDGDERVAYWLNSPNGTLVSIDDYETYTNDDGRVDITWLAPAGSATGGWQLVLQGAESGIVKIIPFAIQ
ncbi:hypothetical protein F8S13_26130 [Chloroflexia bacterium SDU3-3]|nr:hypothetical protein F8S13_26130 [Chloroflexia bacterium SDU3-3]